MTSLKYIYVQVEQDYELLNKLENSKKHESEIMKNIPGWISGQSLYSRRWSSPRFSE